MSSTIILISIILALIGAILAQHKIANTRLKLVCMDLSHQWHAEYERVVTANSALCEDLRVTETNLMHMTMRADEAVATLQTVLQPT